MDSKQIYDYIIKIQSIAKIGLTFSKDSYALTDYQRINDLSMKMLEDFINVKFDRPNYFQRDVYPCPNISVRTVILNKDKSKVLMVRESKDHAWSLPGGWCDLYDSPSQSARNECSQEAGAEINVNRLVGLINRTPYKDLNSVPEYVVIFEANILGKLHEHEYETDMVSWFDINALPMLRETVSLKEVRRMIMAAVNNVTIFD